MKVKFNSTKESNPTADKGLEVLYAPARRQAFRLRWYLILALVAAPFAIFAFKIAHSFLVVNIPAQILFSGSEVRARDAAQVSNILVKPGDTVTKGQLLLEMDNPEWRMRLAQLKALSTELSNTTYASNQNLPDVLNAQLNRAEQKLALVQRLQRQGAATQGEVIAAANERDQRLADLLALEQRDSQRAQQTENSLALTLQNAEEKWFEERLNSLNARANAQATVSEILVQEGENVGPGTLLARLKNTSDATIYAYIDLKHADRAQAGQSLCLKLPDGQIVNGHIASAPINAQSVPADIRAAFSAQKRDLLVEIRPDAPLPHRWLINQLPLTARFSCGWPLNWLW